MEPEVPLRLPRSHPVSRQTLRGIAVNLFEPSFKSWSTERNIQILHAATAMISSIRIL
jgi:hypothetical protein